MVKKPSCQPNVTSQPYRMVSPRGSPFSDTAAGTENLERCSYRHSKCQSCHKGKDFEYSEKLVAKCKEVIQGEMSGAAEAEEANPCLLLAKCFRRGSQETFGNQLAVHVAKYSSA